eukprot:6486379-Amphidinium_carterae.2
MQRSALTWFHTPCGNFLSNEACRTALRLRLNLPLLQPAFACHSSHHSAPLRPTARCTWYTLPQLCQRTGEIQARCNEERVDTPA